MQYTKEENKIVVTKEVSESFSRKQLKAQKEIEIANVERLERNLARAKEKLANIKALLKKADELEVEDEVEPEVINQEEVA